MSRESLEKALDHAWSAYVMKRDKKCQKCGSHCKSEDKWGNERSCLSPHHAFGRRHRATRWDVANGVGLCYPCHIRWAHRDPSGFTEWFKKHVGYYTYERLAEAHNQEVKHTIDDLTQMLDIINSMDRELP